MAHIREIKKRIKSITSTQKVTHAMELIAATKMRKAQMAALSGRAYANNLLEIIAQVKSRLESISRPLLETKDAKNQIIILITSDRGLAGGLNINLFREILRNDPKDTNFITVGKKASVFAAKTSSDILASFTSEEKSPLELARLLAKMATDAYLGSIAHKVSLLYPHFESTAKQTPKWVQILPIELNNQDPTAASNQPSDLIFEPNPQQIIKTLLPHYLLTQIYQILLEAKASEHSARMIAMKNATDAAGDLIEDLTLTYNQARQEAITKELLDITTAQKAFE